MQSLKQQIDALPEPDRTARRSFYSDWEWDNLWELNGFPFQLPPLHEEWSSWTVIAPPKQGATTAGYKWVESLFFNGETDTKIIALMHHDSQVAPLAGNLWASCMNLALSEGAQVSERGEEVVIFRPTLKKSIHFARAGMFMKSHFRDAQYVWGDEIEDATKIVNSFPNAKHFVFTRPTRLPQDTLVSRAGDQRVF